MLLYEGKKCFFARVNEKKIVHSDMMSLIRKKVYIYYYVEWLISK